MKITLGDGSSNTIQHTYMTECSIDDKWLKTELHFLPKQPSEAIIGTQEIMKWGLDLTSILNKCKTVEEPASLPDRLTDQIPTASNIEEIPTFAPEYPEISSIDINLSLSQTEKQELQNLLRVELEKFKQIKGVTPLIKHKIKLKHNTPVKQRPQTRLCQSILTIKTTFLTVSAITIP
ncbi:unnamed protein product [Psylliodes chrysocephalus]|uniref:Uncharacterized protein n=1 Tax=Psylliodes chrysocephalus TaxID=3402493 RepID=A0A9P0GJB6_9CUCU|nr:unnamed protein product [Psylliodes chrysocephala]